MKRFVYFIALAVIVSCKQKQDPAQQILQDYFKSHQLPAAIMGSVDKNGKMSMVAFGPSTWGGTDTLTGDHIFRIFSMTKAIASVGVMQLVEKGVLKLDEPLNKLMPEMDSIPVFDEQGKLTDRHDTITLQHLLTHTSGFGYKFTSSKLAAFHPDKWKFRDDPRLFKSGTAWNYGTSTDWVGKVIEKVSGKDLETYLREYVTGPLKMNSTWFNVPAELQSKIVSWGMRDSTGGFREYPRVPDKPATEFSAGGGLFGSPNDYLRFLRCLLNGGELDGVRIIKPETLAMMLQDHLPPSVHLHFEGSQRRDSLRGSFSDTLDRYGLAWAIEANPAEKIRPMSAVYWAGAANSYYTLDVNNNIAIVYFTNFFPFNDKQSFDFYKLFEKQTYDRLKNQ